MAEASGNGYRERIYFDAELWHEIEALGRHMKLQPRELVKMLTALGLIQMKNLSLMEQARQAMQGAVQAQLEHDMGQDFERLTGIPASTPVMETGSKLRK